MQKNMFKSLTDNFLDELEPKLKLLQKDAQSTFINGTKTTLHDVPIDDKCMELLKDL